MPLPICSHFQDFPVSRYWSCKGAVQRKEDKGSTGKESIIIGEAFEAHVLEKQILI